MGIEKSNVLRNISLCVWDISLLQTDSFYGFRPKTVRSPSQNRTVSEPKTYGFGTENVKGRLSETDYEPFADTFKSGLTKHTGWNDKRFLRIYDM